MQIPQLLIRSLQGIKNFDENAFNDVHQSAEQITSVRINPLKNYILPEDVTGGPVPWCATGYYLHNRPSFTFDPLFHAGCYYVQEASSMFLEQALKQTINLSQPLKVLDLCGAPGGKSIHIQSLISNDSLLVSNEVIRQRANILKDNIIKWGTNNAVVSNNDPKDFTALTGYFDVIVVDAPCSGSGLFRRDAEAINEWSENNVALCSRRQQRILADVLPALKENGILVYSTCSYSTEEDEDIADWLCKEFALQNIRLTIEESTGITETETELKNYCYRFWPYKIKGEGFFLSVFKKNEEERKIGSHRGKVKVIPQKDKEIISQWINADDKDFVTFGDTIYAWPKNSFADFDFLSQRLKLIYSGTALGTMVKNKFIPTHALAMSPDISGDILRYNLDESNAIAYLQRKDIPDIISQKGWQLASFKNHPLGWMNVLQNRINNYYPKELRILKENQ